MLLVIDIGNTNTTLGVYDGIHLRHSWRLSTDLGRTADEYGAMCRSLIDLAGVDCQQIGDIVISSVVPLLDFTFRRMAELHFRIDPLFVDYSNAGMPVLYDEPAELGVDRIVNAVAAFERYGGPSIVIDFGTATTFDAVSRVGEFLGGIICPGIQVSADALFGRAARLRRVDIRKPDHLIATNTASSLQSGLYYGNIALVDGIITRMLEEMGSQARVIATGGLAPVLGKGSDLIETVDADITLEGLRLIYERNRKLP